MADTFGKRFNIGGKHSAKTNLITLAHDFAEQLHIPVELFLGGGGAIDGVNRRHHVRAVSVHRFEHQIFLRRKVIMNARSFHADQRRQIPITETVVAAGHQQNLGVIEQLLAHSIFVGDFVAIHFGFGSLVLQGCCARAASLRRVTIQSTQSISPRKSLAPHRSHCLCRRRCRCRLVVVALSLSPSSTATIYLLEDRESRSLYLFSKIFHHVASIFSLWTAQKGAPLHRVCTDFL